MTLFEYMEDWDNWELSTSERKEQLMDAVANFNDEYGTDHDPLLVYMKYELHRMKQTQS